MSKREHQIMDLAYGRGEITATDLEEALSGKPSNSAVLSYLRAGGEGLLAARGGRGAVRLPSDPRAQRVGHVEATRLL